VKSSNVKFQSSNKAQIPNVKSVDSSAFVIPLVFACLREAASAKAGILKFDIPCPNRQGKGGNLGRLSIIF
jgi:hypothetical protein